MLDINPLVTVGAMLVFSLVWLCVKHYWRIYNGNDSVQESGELD
jgi:hypothetical protein